MTRKQLLAAMGQEQKKIAASRDELRNLQSEIDAIFEDASDGIDSLETAIDALSRSQ